jgi:hypothetical protein
MTNSKMHLNPSLIIVLQFYLISLQVLAHNLTKCIFSTLCQKLFKIQKYLIECGYSGLQFLTEVIIFLNVNFY